MVMSNYFTRAGISKIIAVLALLGWYFYFLAFPIFLSPSDIGRHIKNGYVLLHTPLAGWGAILHTNFYAATQSGFPFINHHWGTGIIFYLVWNAAGFVGLSLFGWFVNGLTLLICFDLARRRAGFWYAALIVFFTVPLIGQRVEVRPEIFSYLLCAAFVWLLTAYRERRLDAKYLWCLPALEVVWINLHIYFILGFAIVGIFWLDEIIRKDRSAGAVKILTIIGLACVAAALVNPSTYRGVLYPFAIFSNYGFSVGENQSVQTIAAQHGSQALVGTNILLFKILFYGLVALVPLAFWRRRAAVPWYLVMWVAVVSILAWSSVRNLALFGFFAAPLLAAAIGQWRNRPAILRQENNSWWWVGLSVAIVALTVWLNWPELVFASQTRGVGLMPGVNKAALFLLDNQVEGPLFNDFDSGSYVIFSLFPRVRPFVDNRPEAYPPDFLTDTYVPMQTDNNRWLAAVEQYRFNVILYSFDDVSPYATPFIIRRLQDPAWAPVYADKYAIIFLKRNQQNAALIQKFEIPPGSFGVEKKS